MMRPFHGCFTAFAVGVFVAPAGFAHHGFGTFVMDEDVEITGTVTGLDFVNPHAWLYLDVTQDDGEVTAMRCEMRSATTLRRSGWSPELFPEGEQVTITGSPDRDDPFSCYVSTVIFDDGSSLDRYGQVSAPADIGQGERPLRLANGQPNISGDWAQEQRVMTDSECMRDLHVAEDELVDDYVDGSLSDDQKARFEEHFLCSPERRQKLDFARALQDYVETAGARKRERTPL